MRANSLPLIETLAPDTGNEVQRQLRVVQLRVERQTLVSSVIPEPSVEINSLAVVYLAEERAGLPTKKTCLTQWSRTSRSLDPTEG